MMMATTPTINRTAWADAYKLHAAALEKLAEMDQESFWKWYHEQAIKIANDHNNDALILGLLMVVVDDVEAADIARQSA